MAVFMHIENESIPWDLGGCVWMWVVLVVCTVVKVQVLWLVVNFTAWYLLGIILWVDFLL